MAGSPPYLIACVLQILHDIRPSLSFYLKDEPHEPAWTILVIDIGV